MEGLNIQQLMNDLPGILGAISHIRGHVDAHNEAIPALLEAVGKLNTVTQAIEQAFDSGIASLQNENARLAARMEALEKDLRALRTELGNAPEKA